MLVNDPALIAPYFTFYDQTFSAGAGQGVKICKANASRIALVLSMTSGTAFIRAVNSAVASAGISLPTGPSVTLFKFADYGGWMQQEFYLTSNLSGNLYVLEVIFRPPQE